MAEPHSPQPEAIGPRILPWFDRALRDLPWRRTRNPYRIWVSEIMLQQTQVGRVIPYYRRFLRVFPSAQALATAPLDDVLRIWAGLGYYSRARNLRAACQVVVEHYGGRVPQSYSDLIALPGVGEYSAGAILSIAFGQRLPALDANAKRVLSRVFLGRRSESARDRVRVRLAGRSAVPTDRPGDYNQALMELGALICAPVSPKCDICPLSSICVSARSGAAERRPRLRRSVSAATRVAVGIVKRSGRVLIAQRPTDGLWGGLWEFPNAEIRSGEDAPPAVARLLAHHFSMSAAVGNEIASLTYGIMSRRLALTAYLCTATRGRARSFRHSQIRWVRPQDLVSYALPSPHRRVAAALLEHTR